MQQRERRLTHSRENARCSTALKDGVSGSRQDRVFRDQMPSIVTDCAIRNSKLESRVAMHERTFFVVLGSVSRMFQFSSPSNIQLTTSSNVPHASCRRFLRSSQCSQEQQQTTTQKHLRMPLLALITEASTGIGKELAIYHAKKGVDVILVYRRKGALEALKAQIEADYNVKAYIFTADLSKAGAAQALYDKVKKAGHEVNILINNAGKRTNHT